MGLKVGSIGLGNIGRPMADNLMAPAFDLAVFDAVPAAAAHFEGRALIAGSPAEVARHAVLIGICVRDENDVSNVLHGPEGLLENCSPGAVIAVHSTIRPSTIRQIADAALARKVHVVDAPVSRGPAGVHAQKFVCMVGAEEAVFEQVRPLLEGFASDLIHAGTAVGAGMTLKLCNNLTTYIELSAAVEAFRLAEAGGLAPELVRDVMTKAGTLTPSMRQFVEFLAIARPDIEQYRTRLEWTLSLANKDLDFALDLSREFGVTLPMTEMARQTFAGAIGLE